MSGSFISIMVEFGCHTWAFNDLTLPEGLGTIARLGFRYVDIGSGPTLNVMTAATKPAEYAAEIRQDIETFNLKLSDLHLMLPRISLADETKRGRDIALFKALLPFAVALGAPGITLSPGIKQPAEDLEAQDRTVAALREMVKTGQAADLQVSIEPHLDSMAQTPDVVLKLIEDVPGLKLTLDWASMVCQGVAHNPIVGLLPHVRHVHLRQAARNRLQTPFDSGNIDFAQVFAALQKADYKGVICIRYMNAPLRHGMMEVNTLRESSRLRDVLRALRDAPTTPKVVEV